MLRLLCIFFACFAFADTSVELGFLTPANPSLDTAAFEIIQVGQFLNRCGLCPATSGNISVRLTPCFVAITASGKHKGELTQDDILVVNLDGKPQHTHKKPSAETLLHTSLYALFEDVGAVIHHHTINGCVLSHVVAPSTVLITKGFEIHKAFPGIKTHESEVVIPIFENSQDIAALAHEICTYLRKHPRTFGYLIRDHGLYTWGKDMKEARIRVEAFENLFESEIKIRLLQGNQ